MMKPRTLLSILVLLSALTASAYDAEIEGVYYNFNFSTMEAEVTSGDTKYTGSVTIPETVTYQDVPYSVTSIGNSAFFDCRNLVSVTIPGSVTSMGDFVFQRCSSLTSVIIPDRVTSIGKSAFNECSRLTSVIIPDGVTSIGEFAFEECSSLFSVSIPSSVKSIKKNAFYHCTSLTSVTLPDGVTNIGMFAFQYCSRLSSVTIPGSVTSIGRSAFDDCDLKSVVTLIEEPFAINRKNESNYRTFSINTFNNATLYVPAGTIDKYKATEGWKDFENIEEIDVTEVSEVKAMPVLLQREGSELIVNGAAAGIPISVYDLSGKLIGNTTATEGTTRVQATASAKVVIVKVGERSVKLR